VKVDDTQEIGKMTTWFDGSVLKHDYDLATEGGIRAACNDPRFITARFMRMGGPCYSIVFRNERSPSGKQGVGFVNAEFADSLKLLSSPSERV
jgi:hypothetical protein